MSSIDRGFVVKRRGGNVNLPPGQYATEDFPVLSAGPTPPIPLATWEFSLVTETGETKTWSWEQLRALPNETITTDIHYVTRWSKFGTRWEGVSIDTLLAGIETSAKFAMAHSYGGYSTNVPLADLLGSKARITYRFDSQDLEPEHGGPARLLVPHLYFWKSAKWVRGLTLMLEDKPGFWEEPRLPHIWGSVEGTTVPGRLSWHVARLVERRKESVTASTLVLDVADWSGHVAGQHVDVRLRAADGYTAVRTYSIANPPDGARIELTIELLLDGEVSPYLVETIAPGSTVEILGPIGGWFVWRPEQTEPVQLIAGGSGVVPLMAMIRTRQQAGSRVPFRLLYSVRSPEATYYKDELTRLATGAGAVQVAFAYTRTVPPNWPSPPKRIDAASIEDNVLRYEQNPTAYVCGPTKFVEAITGLLTKAGYDAARIKTERFGPTGR